MRKWFFAVSFAFMVSPALADMPQDKLHAAIAGEVQELGKPNPDFAKIRTAMEGVVADPAFPALGDIDRLTANFALGLANYRLTDYAAALKALRTASDFPNASDTVWGYRFYAAMSSHEYDEAALSVVKIAGTWPSSISNISDNALLDLDGYLNTLPAEEKRHNDLLEALAAVSWRPQDPSTSADPMWVTLARNRLAAGDIAGATAAARRVSDGDLLIEMKSDKRFDPLVAADPSHYDIKAAYERSLSDAKAQSAAMPDKLIGVNAVANLLIALDRGAEALTLLDDAIARGKKSKASFSDYDDQIIWVENARSAALFLLNRTDEAFAAMKAGADTLEQGSINISQAINLADNYNDFDRATDALAAVAKLDSVTLSSYGLTALAEARADAYYVLKDQNNLDKQLAYLRAHADEGWRTYLGVLVYIDAQDELAKAVIADLEDPGKRPDMLLLLQDYQPGSGQDTPRSIASHNTFMAVRARPEVQAEIMKVGRVAQYPRLRPFH